jgi:hypothetical protein
MVYKAFEDRLAKADADDEEAKRQAEEEELLHGGANDFPQTLLLDLEGLHASNIISVVTLHEKIYTGTGDGTVQCLDMEGIIYWRMPLSKGGILSLSVTDFQRRVRSLAIY